jgi:hypothetical protein
MSAVPGTYEPGYAPAEIREFYNPEVAAYFRSRGALGPRFYKFGECSIVVVAREPAGVNGERLWHLSISHPERHPTWDEIKVARYELLDKGRCFGMLLPPPEFYVNLPEQDHVFHLWEITDPREPWSGR